MGFLRLRRIGRGQDAVFHPGGTPLRIGRLRGPGTPGAQVDERGQAQNDHGDRGDEQTGRVPCSQIAAPGLILEMGHGEGIPSGHRFLLVGGRREHVEGNAGRPRVSWRLDTEGIVIGIRPGRNGLARFLVELEGLFPSLLPLLDHATDQLAPGIVHLEESDGHARGALQGLLRTAHPDDLSGPLDQRIAVGKRQPELQGCPDGMGVRGNDEHAARGHVGHILGNEAGETAEPELHPCRHIGPGVHSPFHDLPMLFIRHVDLRPEHPGFRVTRIDQQQLTATRETIRGARHSTVHTLLVAQPGERSPTDTEGRRPMKIASRRIGDITILDLEGKLTHGRGDVSLRQELLEQLEAGRRRLVVNLGGITTIDSSGLGELIRCKVTCDRRHAVLKLLNVNLKAYRLLTMTRLIGVFDMYDEEARALESFQA